MKFKPAKQTIAFKKLAVYGGPGQGKSVLALSAPGKKLVIDTEGGTIPYASLADFEVVHTQSFGEIKDLIDELEAHPPAEETTLIIDSGSIIWSGLQQAMLEKKLAKEGVSVTEGTERIQNSMADWGILKKWHKSILASLMALKCHVVCTFRESEVRDEVTFKGTGVFNPEWEKSSPYTFDFVGRISARNFTFTKGRMAKDGKLIDLIGRAVAIPTVHEGKDLPLIWKNLFGDESGKPTEAHPSASGELKDVEKLDKDPEATKLAHKIYSNLLPISGILFEDLSLYLLNKKTPEGDSVAKLGEDGKLHLSSISMKYLNWIADVLEDNEKCGKLKAKILELRATK